MSSLPAEVLPDISCDYELTECCVRNTFLEIGQRVPTARRTRSLPPALFRRQSPSAPPDDLVYDGSHRDMSMFEGTRLLGSKGCWRAPLAARRIASTTYPQEMQVS
jgi:hypothetical protein